MFRCCTFTGGLQRCGVCFSKHRHFDTISVSVSLGNSLKRRPGPPRLDREPDSSAQLGHRQGSGRSHALPRVLRVRLRHRRDDQGRRRLAGQLIPDPGSCLSALSVRNIPSCICRPDSALYLRFLSFLNESGRDSSADIEM